jgi:hypothetical protein
MLLKLTDREKLKITDEALSHIKKVETNPDIKMEKVDPYDAWYAFNERVDFNVSEADLGVKYKEGQVDEWTCSAYAVELNKDETFRINTDVSNLLFTYKQGKVKFYNE